MKLIVQAWRQGWLAQDLSPKKTMGRVLPPPIPSIPGKYVPAKTKLHPEKKSKAKPNLQENFLKRFAPFAILTEQMTHIPASVTLAQAALESGWGKHAPGYNFFGIKGEGTAGSQTLRTQESIHGNMVKVKSTFRKYHDALESFLDHAQIISQNPLLNHAMLHTESPESFVTSLQSKKTKYATDPHYVEKILSIIARYDLKKFDTPPKL